MVATPLRFLKVEEKVFATEFGKAPEALDAIDMIFPAGELILVMVDAVMLVTTQHEAVLAAC